MCFAIHEHKLGCFKWSPPRLFLRGFFGRWQPWRSFWQSSWHSIWHILWLSWRHFFWRSFCILPLAVECLSWRRVFATALFLDLSGNSLGILSGISYGFLGGISSGALSVFYPWLLNVFPGAGYLVPELIIMAYLTALYIWHKFGHSIWHICWRACWHVFWPFIGLPAVPGTTCYTWRAIILLHIFWHFLWHIFWHSVWHPFWHIFWHSIWHMRWRWLWQGGKKPR